MSELVADYSPYLIKNFSSEPRVIMSYAIRTDEWSNMWVDLTDNKSVDIE